MNVEHGYDTTLSTAIGFAIQECYTQFESFHNGFTNDNDSES